MMTLGVAIAIAEVDEDLPGSVLVAVLGDVVGRALHVDAAARQAASCQPISAHSPGWGLDDVVEGLKV